MHTSRFLLCFLLLSATTAAQELTDADKALIQKIQEAGGQAMPLAKNDARLTVAFHLSDKDVTDDTLAILKDAASIHSLNLRGTKITDAGLAHIAGLNGLTRLHLEKTAVTDAGLAHIAALPALEYLNLYETKVTDAGLPHLAGIKSLRRLFVWQSGITEAGEETLKAANAEIQIVPDFRRDREREIAEAGRA
ncbi:MAG: hypothetical protein ACKPJD_06970, partial [Planctomycetaceae bacterium]